MPWGFFRAVAMLAGFSATIDIALAVYRREKLGFRTLNYWDEAAVFLAIFLAAIALI
jgi:hypothetical protein